jgi:IS1 family transposase
VETVKIMLVRGIGIGDISVVLNISITKVLKVLKTSKYTIKPKKTHYDCLEIDEFWTYVGKKANKLWLIADFQSDAYHRETGEIVAANLRFGVWGKRDLKTAQKLRRRMSHPAAGATAAYMPMLRRLGIGGAPHTRTRRVFG